jgi:hypothetical protein
VYSEDLMDMCLVKCNLCTEAFFYHLFQLHINREHPEAAMEPQGKIQFVRKTYYR